jgi:hypothetical protein
MGKVAEELRAESKYGSVMLEPIEIWVMSWTLQVLK